MIECHIQDINSNFSERHVLFSTLRLQRAFWEVRKKRDLLGENLHFDLYLDNKGLEKVFVIPSIVGSLQRITVNKIAFSRLLLQEDECF